MMTGMICNNKKTEMKNKILLPLILLLAFFQPGCKKEVYPGKYPGGQISPYISIFDIRTMYKGSDVTLNKENMFGSGKITAVVVSDHSGKNVPDGLLILQDKRRLSQLRGIAVQLGAEAATYLPGDSLIIDVEVEVVE